METSDLRNSVPFLVIGLACTLFSVFTVVVQVEKLGLAYLQTDQVRHHANIIGGRTYDPYQYRVLSEYVVEAVIIGFRRLGVSDAAVSGFILFRVFQNFIIFCLVCGYYRSLGLNTYVALVGMTLLAWAMTQSLYNSDLSFNTYSDIIFYLAAGLLILHKQYGWIVPITGLAALNRETSGLIPVMLILYSWYEQGGRPQKKALMISGAAWALYGLVFVGLRLVYGWRPMIIGYDTPPGMASFMYNLSHGRVYLQLFATMSILPLTAVFAFRQWPVALRAFFWAVFLYLIIHLCLVPIPESRYFLTPLALIFIPGTLFGIVNRRDALAVAGCAKQPV